MRKEKTLVMYRALPKDQEIYMSALDRLLNQKKNTFAGYLNVFNFHRVLLAARKADVIAM